MKILYIEKIKLKRNEKKNKTQTKDKKNFSKPLLLDLIFFGSSNFHFKLKKIPVV